jgi:hypothetical protein
MTPKGSASASSENRGPAGNAVIAGIPAAVPDALDDPAPDEGAEAHDAGIAPALTLRDRSSAKRNEPFPN